jgi:hypothetical protein
MTVSLVHSVEQSPDLPLRLIRDWYPTRRAAALLGIPERTLRRRLQRPEWIQGIHYRWVVRTARQTLEVNVPAAVQLMNRRGWA